MKTILTVALLAVAYLASVEATVDACPQTDHLYYDKSCCDGEDKNCLDGILQTDKGAIDNLVGLKRADGAACADDDLLKYSIDAANNFTGVVCAAAGGGGGGAPAGYTLEANGKTCEGAGVGNSAGYTVADEAACATECNNEPTCQGFSFGVSTGANAGKCWLYDACTAAGASVDANYDSYSKD